MTAATERQVLYAMVAAAWFIVVAILAVTAAAVGLSPIEWSIVFGIGWLVAAIVGFREWRRTGRLVLLALLVFVGWAIGTLLTR